MKSFNEYFDHHRQLLLDLYQLCQTQAPFNSEQASETDQEILNGLKSLSEATVNSESFQHLGQAILPRIIANYPHITPAIDRDLLWFFAGDCLHFMADEEIALYQQLDELLHDSHALEFQQAKARVFQLH